MKDPKKSRLVAIVGGSGAGKTWLASRIEKLLKGRTTRLSLDDFYLDRSHLPPGRRDRINFDHPRAIDWPRFEHALHDGRSGNAIRLPRYDFATHTRLPSVSTRPPKPLILVDGLWLLHRMPVRQLFDLSIFIDCPEQTRFRRRLVRDTAERGRSRAHVCRQLQRTVVPMHRRHVQPQIRWATVTLRQPYRMAEVRRLADHLWHLLEPDTRLTARTPVAFRAKLQSLMQKSTSRHD